MPRLAGEPTREMPMPHRRPPESAPLVRTGSPFLLAALLAALAAACDVEQEPDAEADAAVPEPSWGTEGDAASALDNAQTRVAAAEQDAVAASADVIVPGRPAGATSFEEPVSEGTGTSEPPSEPAEPSPSDAEPVQVAGVPGVAGGTSPHPLDGRWIGGPPGTPEVLIEVAGTLVTARPLDGDTSEGTLFEVMGSEGNHVTFRAARDGNIVEVHALFLTPDQALVWVGGEGEAQIVRRVGTMPEALLGEWEGFVPGDGRPAEQVIIEADAIQVRLAEVSAPASPAPAAEEMQRTPIYALAGDGETLETVAVAPTGSRTVRFRLTDEGALLSWSEDGNVAVLYRMGAMPAWIETLQPAAEVVPEPVPTDGTGEAPVPPTPSADDGATELRRLAELASAYYAVPRLDPSGMPLPPQFPSSTGWAPVSEDCPLWSSDPAAFAGATWTALGFVPAGPVTYQFRFISEGADAFDAQARIDRDCDGVYHKLSVAGFGDGISTRLEEVVEENPGE